MTRVDFKPRPCQFGSPQYGALQSLGHGADIYNKHAFNYRHILFNYTRIILYFERVLRC